MQRKKAVEEAKTQMDLAQSSFQSLSTRLESRKKLYDKVAANNQGSPDKKLIDQLSEELAKAKLRVQEKEELYKKAQEEQREKHESTLKAKTAIEQVGHQLERIQGQRDVLMQEQEQLGKMLAELTPKLENIKGKMGQIETIQKQYGSIGSQSHSYFSLAYWLPSYFGNPAQQETFLKENAAFIKDSKTELEAVLSQLNKAG